MSFDDFPDDIDDFNDDDPKNNVNNDDEKSSEKKNIHRETGIDLNFLDDTGSVQDEISEQNNKVKDSNDELDLHSLEEESQQIKNETNFLDEDSHELYGDDDQNAKSLRFKTEIQGTVFKRKNNNTKQKKLIYKDGTWSHPELEEKDNSKFNNIEIGKTAITGICDEKNNNGQSLKNTTFTKTLSGLTKGHESITMSSEEETMMDQSISQAMLVVKSGTLRKKIFPIGNSKIVLGRSVEADITLPDARASRRHAQVTFNDGCYVVEDLNSANGIKVNGNKVEKYLLQSQDRISIGNTILEFIIVDPSEYSLPEDNKSEFLDFNPESPTELASKTFHIDNKKTFGTATIQNMKTEVVEKHTSFGVDEVEDVFDFNTLHKSSAEFDINNLSRTYLKAKGVERPVSPGKLLKSFFIMVIAVIIFGAIAIMLMYGGSVVEKKEMPKIQEAAIPATTVTGLTAENEKLAISHYNRAKNYYEREEYQNAIKEAQRALSVFPAFIQAREIVEYSRAALEEIRQKALTEKEKLKEQEEYNRIENLLNQADKLLLSKKYKEALVPINQVLKINPFHEEAIAMRSEAENAIRQVQTLVQKRQQARNLMNIRSRQADNLFKSGDYIAARNAYRRVMSMGRGTSPSVYDHARQRFNETTRLINQKFLPRIEEAKNSMKILDYSKAVKILNEVINAYPEHFDAITLRKKAMEELTLQVKKIFQRALVVESVNDLEEASEEYQKILKMVPEDHEYYKKALQKIRKYN